jgi:hypothetical protein
VKDQREEGGAVFSGEMRNRRSRGDGRKRIEPVRHLSVAWWDISTNFFERNAMEAGLGLLSKLYYRNHLRSKI